MLADVAALLRCPQCPEDDESALVLERRTLRCPRGHSFDVAKQGYVNLLGAAVPHHADTAAMVAARDRFLGSGAYAPIRDALRARVHPVEPDDAGRPLTVLEAGAGTGYYLAGALGERDRGLALDISPAAARRAARAHPRIGAVVADTWAGLPVRSGTVDVLLAVFAPRNPAEFARVLCPQGRALVVAPLPDHLAGLREALGLLEIEADKEAHLLARMAGYLVPDGHTDIRFSLRLTEAAVADLVGMGPNAFHDRSGEAGPLPDEVGVAVRLWEFITA
ncbi:putative RNA methyltransferase [Raineyella fluvialis]|uniref:23S rRNA m(1)G-748 methyltransferase n=1 Tax=Raineyella fluvialis TaxID=2662261 RepID=A0A5Q2FDS9_9ACTN|nr:methyltransferase domain-containing protein [Raineyella fluvialis]QGF24959.1 hypothetical protein Rai3103_16550 [Raineyella fluvialis]